MSNNLSTNRLHPLSLLLMSIIFLMAVFLKLPLIKLTLIYFVFLPYLFQGDPNPKQDFKKISYISFAVLLLVIMKIIYAHESIQVILTYGLRMFFLFSISTFAFAAIDFDKIFNYLMATGKLKVNWGYPLLLAMNSLQMLKSEQERISFNAKLRQLRWHQRYFIFFPVLVFAIRHSERGAMSLVTRGLRADRIFYNVNYPTKRDRIILISYFLLTLTFFLVG